MNARLDNLSRNPYIDIKDERRPRDLVWVGGSRDDMRALPSTVRRAFGLALFAAQVGETPPSAKPLRGFGGGAGVLELVENHRRDTYRAVYTVRYATAVYVLHVFQKKSKRGIATAGVDIDLIRRRLRAAEQLHSRSE